MNDKQKITGIALRLLAVYFLSEFVVAVAAFLGQTDMSDLDEKVIWVLFLEIAFNVGLSACLWFCAYPIARKVYPYSDSEDGNTGQSLDGNVILSVGLMLMGMWFALPSIVSLIGQIFSYISLRGDVMHLESNHFNVTLQSGILQLVVKIAIGVWLIMGNKKIVECLIRFRKFDQNTVTRRENTSEEI